MNDINKLYALWLENTKDDSETQNELLAIKDNPDEILDRFYKNLEFGNMSMQEQKRISQEIQDIQQSFIKNYGAKLVEKANKIKEGYEKDCPDLAPDEKLAQLFQTLVSLEAQLKMMDTEVPAQDESVPTDSIKA